MGADSVSRGAWRLPPSVGGHAKAAVDDYWARPLRCATGSDPSPFRPLPASRSARTGLIDLLPRWLVARMLPISAYMIVTRGAVALWAMPLDRAGRFRKRIAIVGGGARPKAIHIPGSPPGLDIDIVGLFDDRFDDRSPKSIRTHDKLGKNSELAVLRVSIGSISSSSLPRSMRTWFGSLKHCARGAWREAATITPRPLHAPSLICFFSALPRGLVRRFTIPRRCRC